MVWTFPILKKNTGSLKCFLAVREPLARLEREALVSSTGGYLVWSSRCLSGLHHVFSVLGLGWGFSLRSGAL